MPFLNIWWLRPPFVHREQLPARQQRTTASTASIFIVIKNEFFLCHSPYPLPCPSPYYSPCPFSHYFSRFFAVYHSLSQFLASFWFKFEKKITDYLFWTCSAFHNIEHNSLSNNGNNSINIVCFSQPKATSYFLSQFCWVKLNFQTNSILQNLFVFTITSIVGHRSRGSR